MLRFPVDKDTKARLLESLVSMDRFEGFKLVVKWLEDELARISTEGNTIKDETSLRWNQGQFQLLNDFIQKIHGASETLGKLSSQPQPKGRA